ncbi:hypothetical protein [Rhodoferax saidenbachensis]|uniref:Uncharacterized protein n=1 Tax=Rhodoferax saidenbachensis TaxID=1484693 RepID=A0A1P8KEL5_9BURK|nr:hypothetical protein [Rhodoferax saidenbachensis]APW44405.1 hypothetical protein RS694_19030 [Rhodoferax saidenbachensis]
MLSDAEVIQLMRQFLAGQMPTAASGLQGVPSHMLPGWPEPPAAEAGPEAQTPPVNLNTLPDKPPIAPLLPILEEVQLQNAQVLPEIDQTLAQIDVSIGGVDQAGVSLEPAPLQIPKIEEAMTEAGGNVKKTLDAL